MTFNQGSGAKPAMDTCRKLITPCPWVTLSQCLIGWYTWSSDEAVITVKHQHSLGFQHNALYWEMSSVSYMLWEFLKLCQFLSHALLLLCIIHQRPAAIRELGWSVRFPLKSLAFCQLNLVSLENRCDKCRCYCSVFFAIQGMGHRGGPHQRW